MPGDGKKDKNSGNKKLNTADLLKNLRQQTSIAFGNDYEVEDDDEYEDQMEDINDSSYIEDPQNENQPYVSNSENNDNNDNDEEIPVDELENDEGIGLDENSDQPLKGRIVKEETEIIIGTKDKEQEEKEREEFEKKSEDLLKKIEEDEKININNYDLKPKDLKGTLFDFSEKEDPNKKVEEIFKNIDDNLKNVLGDNIIDLDDFEDKPEIDSEIIEKEDNIEIGENTEVIENTGSVKDINSLTIDEPEEEPELKDLRTDLQKAEDKVNEWLLEEDEPEHDLKGKTDELNKRVDELDSEPNKKEEIEEPEDELKRENEELTEKVDEPISEPNKEEPSDKTNEIIEKTQELSKKVEEMVSQPFPSENEPVKEETQPEKEGPKPEDLTDNGQVRDAFVQIDGEKMLPKQQLNHLSDMIDDINKANGTAFSSRGINKYLSNQFKHGQGESLEEQRNSFKGSYTSFCKEAYQNMLEKRAKMPVDKRPSLEQTLADYQKFTKQLENLSKANGWMHSETEMGPFGGLEPSEIKKMQKAAVDKEPKNTLDAVRNEIGGKVTSNSLKEFSDKFKEQVNNVPQADKESGMQGPEAAQAISKLKALNDVHNARGRGFRFRHPILYRREGKLLDSSMKELEEKGYDREIINQMLKEKDLQDPAKEAHEKDVKAINDLEKKTSKQTRDFEERKEREDYLARKNIKGMRKQISVPEADNSKDLVNVSKEMKSPAVSKKLEIQKTNQMQMAGGKK